MWPVFVNLESERMEPSSETARPPSHWPLVLVVAYLPLGYLLNSLPGSATIEMVSDRSLVLLDAIWTGLLVIAGWFIYRRSPVPRWEPWAFFAAMALLLSSTLLAADPQLVVNVAWYLHDKPVLLWWAGAAAQVLLLLELAFVLRLLWLGMAPWRGGPTSAPSSASSTATAPTPPPQ